MLDGEGQGSRFLSRSPEETHAAGAALGRAFEAAPERGLVLALRGPLGAGKTAFVKGVASGLGLDPDAITSPTFVIAAELECPSGLRLVHADLYRLESAAELERAGLCDWLEGGLVAIEWADRFPESLPADRLEIRFEMAEPPSARWIAAAAGGPGAARLLARWRPHDAEGRRSAGEETGTWR